MSLATNITNLATRVATEVKALRTLINGNGADLSALNTTAKSNLVAAINELVAAVGGAGATIDDGQISTLTVWSSDKTDDEIDDRISTAITELLGAAPAELDTLKEIADKLADNDDVVASLVSQIATKADDNVVVKLSGNQTIAGIKTFSSAPVVPDDSFAIAKVSGLSAALSGKVETSDLGDPDTNFVTVFEAGLS